MASSEGREKTKQIRAAAYDTHFKNWHMSDSGLLLIAFCIGNLISGILWLLGVDNALWGLMAFTVFSVLTVTELSDVEFVKAQPIPSIQGQLILTNEGNIRPAKNSELEHYFNWLPQLKIRVTSKETGKQYEMKLRPNEIFSPSLQRNSDHHVGLNFSATIALDAYVYIKEKIPLALAVAFDEDSPAESRIAAEKSIEKLSCQFFGQFIIDTIEGSKDEQKQKAHENVLLKQQIAIELDNAQQSLKESNTEPDIEL